MLSCEHCHEDHDEAHSVCPVTGKLFRAERLFPLGMVLEGKYRLDKVLGAGGMGVVFRATHTLLDKPVAVKLTLPQMARDDHVMARMVREARAASGTGHRNIATVTDMGWTQDGGLFLVMEYLEGRNLHEMVSDAAPLEVTRAVGLTAQILSGLSAVHAKGVVHRDLKPENVMVVADEEGREQAKVLDFGISKILGDDQALELTQTGMVMGSPRYMSPEQARGLKDLDQRVDIYATGGILFTLLVGSPPLSADNYHAMLAQILAGRIPRPSAQVPAVPRGLDAVVLRSMALKPCDRYADATSFRAALMPFASVADGGGVTAVSSQGGPGDVARTATAGGDLIDLSSLSPDSLVALDEVAGGAGPPSEVSAARSPGDGGMVDQGTTDPGPGQAQQLPDDAFGPAQAPDSVFGPEGAQDTALEVDLGNGWSGGPAPGPAHRQPSQAQASSGAAYGRERSSSSDWVSRAVAVAVLVALGLGGWWFYSHYLEDPEGYASADEAVMVLVETEPRDAEVYVDGVLQVTAPIQLPRSDGHYSVRISAPGYRSKTVSVRADRTHTVRVSLDPMRTRR